MNLKDLQSLPPPWGRARERGRKQPLATGRAVGTEEPNVPSGFALPTSPIVFDLLSFLRNTPYSKSCEYLIPECRG